MFKNLTNILNKIKFFSSSLNVLIDLRNIKPKFIFFSENKSYQKYLKPIIHTLILNNTYQVYYLSIDKDDKIDDKRVSNYFIHPLLINFIFNSIKAENIFLTLTDLGNNLIKKTKNIDNYIYYFHSPVSTTKNYTPKAFDNYDVIMCNGQYQVDEIRSREHLKKLNKKKLIPSGYFYFDHLIKNINQNINCNEILIAPSWNKNIRNSINENFIELIDTLIKKNFKVIFRPHPEHFKRSMNILDNIKKKFNGESFKFDVDANNIKSMERSKCLITDNSGIAIEYVIALKRPVLYLNEHDKIHNSNFEMFKNLEPMEDAIKKNFGYTFNRNQIHDIDKIIEKLLIHFNEKNIDNFINSNFYNFKNTISYFDKNLKKICTNL